MKKNTGEIITLQIGSETVQMETVDPVEVAKANARIQKKINPKKLRQKELLRRAKANSTASKIILNC
jgi:hypothetical protein